MSDPTVSECPEAKYLHHGALSRVNVESQNPFYTSPHSLKARVLRVLWQVVWAVLFVSSPRPFHGWRQFLLRVFGARIGKGNHFYPTCRIPEPWKIVVGNYSCVGPGALLYASGGITIGSYVTVSQYAHICTSSHDYDDPAMRQTFAPVIISDRAWICADAFVGPGVTIHRGAVVGARAVVTKEVEAWTVMAGNPARQIGNRQPIEDGTTAGPEEQMLRTAQERPCSLSRSTE